MLQESSLYVFRTHPKTPGRDPDMDSRIQVEGWRKMEVAAKNRAKYGDKWGSVGLCSTEGQSSEDSF